MPIQVSYPGVYVSAITSPQPPAGGASTSIAAFVGRAPMGPVDQAVQVLNYADYTRKFGGLNKDSAISYQANAFFGNGGSQAVVVRVYSAPISTSIEIGGTPVATDTYTVEASLNGAPLAPATGSGATPADVATTLATSLLAVAIPGGGTLAGVITATVAAGSSTIAIGLVPGATQAVSFTASAKASTGTPGGTIAVTGPTTVAFGTATLPITTSATLTVGGTVTVGDVYTLFLTPPGSPAVQVAFTAATTVAGDVATGLANAVNGDVNAKRLVAASAASAVLTLAYLATVEVTTQVNGTGTLTLGTSTPLFNLSAASPGLWGDEIIASIVLVPTSSPLYQKYGLDPTNPKQALFNLTVYWFDGANYQTETFLNCTLWGTTNQVNRLDKVLENGSQYVRYAAPTDNSSPPSVTIAAPGTAAVALAAGGAESLGLQPSDYTGDAAKQTGLYALTQLPYGWNILCVPPDTIQDAQGGDQDASVYQEAAQICVENNAMLIIDPPTTWYSKWQSGQVTGIDIDDPLLGSYTEDQARSSAVYFPRVVISDPLMAGQPKVLPPCGFMAAAWASTDNAVGVWKAPAGLDVPIGGITGLQAKLSDADSGQLNPQGINTLRSFKTGGDVVWGARTLRGSDTLGDQYKYVPVRRLLLFIETSLQQNTLWAVFQPNGSSLWARLQTQITTFMSGLFAQGAFAGTSASQAFLVKCDSTTTLPSDQAAGIVNVQVGFAPLYPAEFVVITVSQQTASKSG